MRRPTQNGTGPGAPLLRLPLDDLARTQLRDRLRVIAERGEHLLGMGAERGRHAVEPAAAMGELEPAAGEAQPAIGRIDLLNGAARGDLRMIDDFLDLPDAGTGRACGVQDLFPLARVLFRERLLDDGPQRRLVFLPGE